MKVNNLDTPVGGVASKKPAGTPQKSSGASFDALLGQASAAGSAGAAANPQGPSALGEIRAPMPVIAGLEPSPTPVAEKTSRMISLLEAYALKMDDGKTPLKEIASLMGEMETLATELSDAAMVESDPRLKELAEESSALAAIESIKFRRGDYL